MADRLDPPDNDDSPCKDCWEQEVANAATQGVSDFITDNGLGEVEYDEDAIGKAMLEAVQACVTHWGQCKAHAREDQADYLYEREVDRRMGL